MSESPVVIFSRDEIDLIAAFAGCSLDEKPGSNWVQESGGLPEYICQIARAIKRTGKTTSQAIAIAVSRIKKWATGAGVDKDTQAKAVKALAQWEAKRVKSKAKTAGKAAAKESVKASSPSTVDSQVLLLAKSTDYNVNIVQEAFREKNRAARDAYWKANPQSRYDDAPTSMWVKEQWTTFLIVASDYGDGKRLYKVPYTVDKDLNVDFGDPQAVKTQYVAVPAAEVDDTGISDTVLAAAASVPSAGCMYFNEGPSLLALSAAQETALERVRKFATKKD